MAFYHEKLIAYQKALAFASWTQPVIDSAKKRADVLKQLERASDSIVLNIAEGNGKFSKKDRGRFLQIAHGSALECAGCLDLLVARKVAEANEVIAGKSELEEIVKILCALMDRLGVRLVEQDEVEEGLESERQRQRQRQNTAPRRNNA